MENIQRIAIERFSNNLLFLEKYDKELYDRIVMLSALIENEEYSPRYHLEYMQEDNEFDIYDSATDSYIYDKKPKEFINSAKNNTNLDKVNSMDLLNGNIYNFRQPLIIDDSLRLQQKEKALVINDVFEYIRVFETSTEYEYKKFKYIEKFVFIGSLLGSHILPIHEKINAALYFICEYNLEIFRLSLFVTPYYKLAQRNGIIFSIMDDDFQFDTKMSKFFHHKIRANYMVKYYCTNYNIHNYFDRILAVSSQKSPLSYTYRKIIEGLLKPAFKNIPNYKIIDTKNNHQQLANTPVLFLAAGPSLGKNIDWLKENQESFIIVAVAATIEKLYDNGIKPDIITSIDADEIVINQFPEKLRGFLKNIPVLASSITHTKVLDIFNKDNLYIFETMAAFKNTSKVITGYSIGEVTLDLIFTLGGDNIYMLGTDLALDQESGSTHIEGHQNSEKYNISKEKKEHNSFIKEEGFHFSKSTILVKGNFQENVVTNMNLRKSIASYNRLLNEQLNLKPSIKIYNLSDGAYFDHTTPLNVSKVELAKQDKKAFNKAMGDFLDNISHKGFSRSEKELLKESLDMVNKMIEQLNLLQKSKVRSYDEFFNERSLIIDMIVESFDKYGKFFIDRLYKYYFLTVEPFLGYQFNEKLKNEEELVSRVQEIWIKQMKSISKEYIDIVEESIKD